MQRPCMASRTSTEGRILQAVYDAIDEVNLQLPEERRLQKRRSTVLLGESGTLESLELINLIVTVEQEIESAFQVTLTFMDDENVLSEKEGPLNTVASFVQYISTLMPSQ